MADPFPILFRVAVSTAAHRFDTENNIMRVSKSGRVFARSFETNLLGWIRDVRTTARATKWCV